MNKRSKMQQYVWLRNQDKLICLSQLTVLALYQNV